MMYCNILPVLLNFHVGNFCHGFFFSRIIKTKYTFENPIDVINVLLDQMIHKFKKKLGYHHSISEKLLPRLIK